MPALLRRRLLLATLALPLAGCGFRLRGPQTMAFETLSISGIPEHSKFAADMRREIEAGGSTRIVSTPEEAEVHLEILNNRRARSILSIAGDGSVREYQINRFLVYRIRHRDGRILAEPTTLRARREYNYDDEQTLAKQREEDLLYEDMERDLLQQLVRRLAAVST
ncbi:MAG TPA: LPS assembly lipoprotein LptE [Azoarcus sp.]|nr:LPS assembly lipoprotein LptE [Azoarcus sp.]